eukprot:8200553-Ditylum_brightwellii.AAC.1
MERNKKNGCVDDDNRDGVNGSVDGSDDGDGVGNSDDGGDKHLTHLSPAVDCCLTERSDPNTFVDDSKEGVDNSDDDCDDCGDKHLTHLTQVENNVHLG